METFLNSDVLKLFVVLLAIFAIVLLFLKAGKNDKSQKVHIYYVSGLCVFVILELVTYICVNNDNSIELIKYISFASTLSSLLLSVVAIIYAIVSNNKGDAQYQKIDRASDRISESVDRFSQISDSLSGNIGTILNKLDEIKDISNATKNALESDKLKNAEDTNSTTLNSDYDYDELYKTYIARGSFSGNLALLACCYSYDNDKPFSTKNVLEKNEEYCYGYIVASSALGIITSLIKDGKFVVKSINLDDMKKMLIAWIEKYIEEADPESFKKYCKDDYDIVNRYFGVTK